MTCRLGCGMVNQIESWACRPGVSMGLVARKGNI